MLWSWQEPVITWVKVEKPSFDLMGVVLGSFRTVGFLLLLALLLGGLMGILFVALKRRRATPPLPLSDVSLHLDGRA
jgi:hypothetical protein